MIKAADEKIHWKRYEDNHHFYCGTRPAREGDPAVVSYSAEIPGKPGGQFRAIYVAASRPVWEKEKG